MTTTLAIAVLLIVSGGAHAKSLRGRRLPMNQVELNADVVRGFNLRNDAQAQLCYLTALKVGDIELVADITVQDPDLGRRWGKKTFGEHMQVVGVSSYTGWETTPTAPVTIVTQVSETARSKLDVLLTKASSMPPPNLLDADFKFDCYNYDFHAQRYYKNFHANDTTLLGSIVAGRTGDALAIHLSTEPGMAVPEPRNYLLSMNIVPRAGAPQQALHYASSVTDKLVMPWGIEEIMS